MELGLMTRGESFAADLANLRKKQGLSEQELAERAGCTWQHIRRYESGEQMPQEDTVQSFNHILVGRDRWGTQIVHVPQGDRQSDLTHIPNDQLVAELQRRLSFVKSE